MKKMIYIPLKYLGMVHYTKNNVVKKLFEHKYTSVATLILELFYMILLASDGDYLRRTLGFYFDMQQLLTLI